MLICPVCGASLSFQERRAVCANNHSYDMAREGYVNLLRTSKAGDSMGDDKYSARSRRDFLNKGYYAPLQRYLTELFREKQGAVLDICCGEGYYTSTLAHEQLAVFGFDISREMVRLAARRGRGTYFVANMASIPVANETFDYATHLFAPFMEQEFVRVLKPGGRLYTVIPGRLHLFGLKQALYDTPYENDEKLPAVQHLRLVSTHKLSEAIHLESHEDIDAVFHMTPYYFHTSEKDRAKLKALSSLDTPIEFIIAEYEKEGR